MRESLFFTLLKAALGQPTDAPQVDDSEWARVFALASRQSLLGIVFDGIKKLGCAPPRELMLKWSFRAEAIRGLNAQMDSSAKKLTELFAAQGRTSAILKGQANAMLYPNPEARQPGDIDIWVSGGKKSVIALLGSMDLLHESTISDLHAHLETKDFGVPVEVHFIAGAGIRRPSANRRLREFLDTQVHNATLTPKGFFAPSLEFAMVMQMAHIYRHFLGLGIGLRQVVDYFVLLQNSTEQERASVSEKLRPFGLERIASAVMWILGEFLGLDKSRMICEPCEWRGRLLFAEIMDGGNFGKHAKRAKGLVFLWWVKNRLRLVRLMKFDYPEIMSYIAEYWLKFALYIPLRLRLYVSFVKKRRK